MKKIRKMKMSRNKNNSKNMAFKNLSVKGEKCYFCNGEEYFNPETALIAYRMTILDFLFSASLFKNMYILLLLLKLTIAEIREREGAPSLFTDCFRGSDQGDLGRVKWLVTPGLFRLKVSNHDFCRFSFALQKHDFLQMDDQHQLRSIHQARPGNNGHSLPRKQHVKDHRHSGRTDEEK